MRTRIVQAAAVIFVIVAAVAFFAQAQNVGWGAYVPGATPTPSATPTATATPTSTPSPSPSPSPSASPSPSPSPTATPTPTPSPSPTFSSDLVMPPTAAPTPALAASRAYDFLNSMGVNAHPSTDTVDYSLASMESMTAILGITHMRVSVQDALAVPSTLVSLSSATGMKYDLISDPTQTAATITAAINDVGAANVALIEPVNECDTGLVSPCTTSNFPTEETDGAEIIAAALAGNLTIGELAPSNTSESAIKAVGSLAAYVNFGNTHDYTGTHPAGNSGIGAQGDSPCTAYSFGQTLWNKCLAQIIAPGAMVVWTENGYGDKNGLSAMLNGGDPISNDVSPSDKADYVLSDFLEHWLDGEPRGYYYDGHDDTQSPGYSSHACIDLAGNPKPCAIALHNLRAILADNGSGAATFTPIDPFSVAVNTPTGSAGVSNGIVDSGGFRTLKLVKSTGVVDVITWADCDALDLPTENESACNTGTATATLATTPSAITRYRINGAGDGQVATSTLTAGTTVAMTWENHPNVYELGPAGSYTFATPPPNPIPTAFPTPPAPTPAPTTAASTGASTVSLVESCSGNNGSGAGFTLSCGSATTIGDTIAVFTADSGPAYAMTVAGFDTIDSGSYTYFSSGTGLYSNGGAGFGFLNVSNAVASTSIAVGEPNGGWASGVALELSGVDQINPISADAVSTNQGPNNGTAGCPSITVPRTGSLVGCIIHTVNGSTNSGLLTTAPTVNGWTFEGQSSLPDFQTVYAYVYSAPTTTQNQVIPAFSAAIAGGSTYLPYASHTIAFQPPATGEATPVPVTTLVDLSGNGHNASSIGSTPPNSGQRTIAGLNALDFHGSSQISFSAGSAFASSTLVEICAVLQNTEFGSNESIISLSGGSTGFTPIGEYSASTNGLWSIYQYRGGNVASTQALPYPDNTQPIMAGATHVICSRLDGSEGVINVDGTDIATAPWSTAIAATTGNIGGSGTLGFYGLLGDYVALSAPMTSSARAELDGYEAWKWGFESQLPTANPYYGAAPTGFTPASLANLVTWFDPSNLSTIN